MNNDHFYVIHVSDGNEIIKPKFHYGVLSERWKYARMRLLMPVIGRTTFEPLVIVVGESAFSRLLPPPYLTLVDCFDTLDLCQTIKNLESHVSFVARNHRVRSINIVVMHARLSINTNQTLKNGRLGK